MAHPFIVGEKYWDRTGEYEVLALNPPTMRIRYGDGTERSADVVLKARIYQNILSEQTSLHPYQTADYFRTLGIFSHRADFHAEVPQHSQPNFEERYFMLTGRRPVIGTDNYFPITVATTYDKWGPELRIYVPDRGPTLTVPPGVEFREAHHAGKVRINNNEFWWRLVRLGFRLGVTHDIPQIRGTIPPLYQTDFDGGVDAGR